MNSSITRWRAWTPSSVVTGQLKVGRWLVGSCAVLAFGIGFTGAWLPGLGFLLFIFGTPAAAIGVLVGSIALLVQGFRNLGAIEAGAERVLTVLIAPAMLAATFFGFLPILWTGTGLGDATRLAVNQSAYGEIVAFARARRQPAWYAERGGITYSVDLGPPLRVAFNPAGMLDNWSGIVFDPTGEVMLADGFDQSGKFAAPDRITKLFGGDLVGCRRLWRDYYKCSFT